MRSSLVFTLFFAVSAGLVVVACANGTTSDLSGAGIDAGTSATIPATPAPDATTGPAPDQGRDNDAAAPGKKDSGTSSSDDAGTDAGTSPTGGDCVGSVSAQLGTSYEDACEAFYFNTFGDSNPCRPGANDCASLPGPYTFCCYAQPPGSPCGFAYLGEPQCLPK